MEITALGFEKIEERLGQVDMVSASKRRDGKCFGEVEFRLKWFKRRNEKKKNTRRKENE